MTSISACPVTDANSEELFNWRNDAHTRAMSHSSEPVEWADHVRWFEATLEDPDRCLLMCRLDGGNENVAMVRFDVDGATALISINIAPTMRGKGLAGPCLQTAIRFFHLAYRDVNLIKAEIKAVNPASRKAFEGAGFTLAGKAGKAGEDWLYTKPV